MRYDYRVKLRLPLHENASQFRLRLLTQALGFFASLYHKSAGFCVLGSLVAQFPITRLLKHVRCTSRLPVEFAGGQAMFNFGKLKSHEEILVTCSAAMVPPHLSLTADNRPREAPHPSPMTGVLFKTRSEER